MDALPRPHFPAAHFTLRRAVPEDAATVAHLAARAFEETFTGTCTDADMADYLAETYNVGTIRAVLEDSSIYLWLATDASRKAAGYAQWETKNPPFPFSGNKAVELQRLYVLQPYYGTGLAHQLMDAYETQSAQAGADMLWLGVWEYNDRAQAFYRKRGFSPTGHSHPFPIGGTPQTDDWWRKPV